MQPLVSIITPMYNSEKFILKTINSVVNQTYSNWELLLIDDGSTDNTIQIVEDFKQKSTNIKLLQNPTNLGAAKSRNKGILEAKGDYIAFLDADDLWKPNKLDLQIQFMQTHNCDVSFSSYEQIDENGKRLNKLVQAIPKLTYNKYLKTNYIGNLTGMYNAKTLGKITSPDLRKRQDWLLWLNILKIIGKTKGMGENLAIYCDRSNSISSNKIKMLKYNWIVYNKSLGFGIFKSVFLLLNFIYYYAKKKI